MHLFEVIRWGNESDDPMTGGPDGWDTCFLVRAASVEEAAALADRELAASALPDQRVAAWAGAVYLLGTDLGTDATARVLRGPYVQSAYRHGWRHWYRDDRGAPWEEKLGS
jgi:hypothetical protein